MKKENYKIKILEELKIYLKLLSLIIQLIILKLIVVIIILILYKIQLFLFKLLKILKSLSNSARKGIRINTLDDAKLNSFLGKL